MLVQQANKAYNVFQWLWREGVRGERGASHVPKLLTVHVTLVLILDEGVASWLAGVLLCDQADL